MKKGLLIFLLLSVIQVQVRSQLCNGSLGDPVVNMTFGNDATARGPLKPWVTNMRYTTSACPNDGEYTITNESFGCFGNTWHMMVGDHTGDTGGRFMLVNASPDPSQFFVDTVSGLCANTTFEFATWVANVLKPTACGGAGVKPNLTFRIETTGGVLIQQFNSGDIPFENQKVWKQYGTFFKTPVGVSTVVLKITNNAPGGSQCGNDLALDDITFRPCGPVIMATVDNQLRTQVDVCENQQAAMLFATSFPSEYTNPQVQWQISLDTGKTWKDIPGEQSLTYTRKPTAGGNYQYRAVMAEASNFMSVTCRISSNITVVSINPLPGVITGGNLQGCTGSDFRLNAVDGTAFTYRWSGPNGFRSQVKNPFVYNVSFQDSGWYRVVVLTDMGCTRTDSFHLVVLPGTKALVSTGGNICEGSSMLLSASGGIQYQWSPATGLSDAGSANPLATPADSTRYKVVVTNQYSCTDSAYVTVNVYKRLIVNAGPDKAIFEGDTVTLNGAVTGAPAGIYWLPQQHITNANTSTPVVSPVDNTIYTLYAVSAAGCPLESDNAFVRVYKKLRIPNVFSPNGDGINDSWQIQNMGTYPDAVLRVFSRSGALVFEMRSGGNFWDGTYKGTPVPVGTYYYVIDLKVERPILSGWVVVLR